MSPTAGQFLLSKIVPMIAAVIGRGSIKPGHGEDTQELTADATAQAAAMLDSAEKAGKTVPARSIVFYALQSVRSGRRFGCGGRTDAMGVATQLDGHSELTSMDQEHSGEGEDGDGEFSLHDVLASSYEAPDVQAGRQLDWDMAEASLDGREQQILKQTAEEMPVQTMAELHEITPARIVQIKRQVGKRISDLWGGNPVADVARTPGWMKHVHSFKETRACRYERMARCAAG